jgi:S-adenosylmethionine:tRNA ribosyltransferase-isomerase
VRGYTAEIRLSDYDFELPPGRIAQLPASKREESRLLVLPRREGEPQFRRFHQIGEFLRPGDLVVLNDAKVFPARLRGRRATGGRVELFLLGSLPGDPRRWQALLRPARAGRGGGAISIEGAEGVSARALLEEEPGRFQVELWRAGKPLEPPEVLRLCEEAGEVPLPPYIERRAGDGRAGLDRERYQTVYARALGAVAAPTAGLHFSERLLETLRREGVETAALTLAVGLGTFQPVREETLRTGRLFPEAVEVPAGTEERILAARREGRRVVAVGTTSARALESWALSRGIHGEGGPSRGWADRTELLIAPGFRFAVVEALLTNFHLPRSTLLLLVAAFAGRERVLQAYRKALENGFLFYSYGDAMLIV